MRVYSMTKLTYIAALVIIAGMVSGCTAGRELFFQAVQKTAPDELQEQFTNSSDSLDSEEVESEVDLGSDSNGLY